MCSKSGCAAGGVERHQAPSSRELEMALGRRFTVGSRVKVKQTCMKMDRNVFRIDEKLMKMGEKTALRLYFRGQ